MSHFAVNCTDLRNYPQSSYIQSTFKVLLIYTKVNAW